jgi:hypothetical protein
MDFHPATGATVVQVISSAIAALKNARDLAKDSKDRELKEVIGNAFDLLLDPKERMLALDEENRDLKTQLAKKALITGPVPPFGYLYEKTDEAQPAPSDGVIGRVDCGCATAQALPVFQRHRCFLRSAVPHLRRPRREAGDGRASIHEGVQRVRTAIEGSREGSRSRTGYHGVVPRQAGG